MRRSLVIVGPTASGKSILGMGVARALRTHGRRAEIVCIDSMTVYEGMDIGTSKPSAADQAEVPHHLLDLLPASEEMSLSVFQAHARAVLHGIEERGAVALLVGGTGLYVDAVVNDLTIPGQFPAARAEVNERLERDGAVALHALLVVLDPIAAKRMEPTNERRVVRALEVTLGSGRPFSSFGPGLAELRVDDGPFVLFGVRRERILLRSRIVERFADMLRAGLVDECRHLLDLHADRLSRTAGQALGYREVWTHLRGETSLEDALELAVTRTRQFAVRQERWFRRDPRIVWLDSAEFDEFDEAAAADTADTLARRVL